VRTGSLSALAVEEAHCCVAGEGVSEKIQDCSIEVGLCRWEEEEEAAGH
jgi:hypothetical protein